MEFITTFFVARSLTGFIIRLALILTILMAIYKGGEAAVGVFS